MAEGRARGWCEARMRSIYSLRRTLTPNHAFERTARKRRLRVPSSLRSSAAPQRERQTCR